MNNKRIAFSAFGNIAFAVFSVALQIAISGVTARILTPSDYGVFAFANSIMAYVMHLSQRGLSTKILVTKKLTPLSLGHAYIECAIMACFMVGLVSITLMGMYLVGSGIYSLPMQLTSFMMITLAVQILSTPALAVLQRKLSYVTINSITFASMLIGSGFVGIFTARIGWGPWSLMAGSLVSTLINSGGLMFFGRHPTIIKFQFGPILAGLVQGMKFNLLRSMDVAWLQAPTIILSYFLPSSIVGIYQRAQYLGDLGMQMSVWRISAVIYSALAVRNDGQNFNQKSYRTTLLILATLTLPITSFVFMNAREMLALLLGPQWVDGAIVLKILIIALAINSINHAAGMALEHLSWIGKRLLSSSLAVILVVVLLGIQTNRQLENLAYPSLISSFFGSVLLHYFAGERLSSLGTFSKCFGPGFILAVAAVCGCFFGQKLCELLNLHSVLFSFLMNICCAGIFSALTLPLVVRLKVLAPHIEKFAATYPATYKKFSSVMLVPAQGVAL
jgi:O-antigen/teichoic acid export membrane protein